MNIIETSFLLLLVILIIGSVVVMYDFIDCMIVCSKENKIRLIQEKHNKNVHIVFDPRSNALKLKIKMGVYKNV